MGSGQTQGIIEQDLWSCIVISWGRHVMQNTTTFFKTELYIVMTTARKQQQNSLFHWFFFFSLCRPSPILTSHGTVTIISLSPVLNIPAFQLQLQTFVYTMHYLYTSHRYPVQLYTFIIVFIQLPSHLAHRTVTVCLLQRNINSHYHNKQSYSSAALLLNT